MASTVARKRRDLAVDVDEELAVTPLVALASDPSSRDDEAVRDALDWWLESLPTSGVSLAPEIGLAPLGLLELFRRGRLDVCKRGRVLQEEGEEVRHYTILLQGRCRLRCRAPAGKRDPQGSSSGQRKPAPEAGEEEGEGMDENGDTVGTAGCETIGKGEAVGLVPGNTNSPYQVVSLERTVVLLLTFEDYSLILRPHHRELQAQAVQFLARSQVCPQATPFQLQRLVPFLRHRFVRRGGIMMKAGDPQRQVWILREGSCSLYAPPGEAYAEGMPGDEEEEEEEEDEDVADAIEQEHRIKLLRDMARSNARHPAAGEAGADAAAFENGQKAAIMKHARGPLAKSLRANTLVPPAPGSVPSKAGPLYQRAGAKRGLIATSKISSAGSIVGEEILLASSMLDVVNARCCSTVEADEDCLLFSADVTIVRLLASYVGMDSVVSRATDKLSRHNSHAKRGTRVTRQLERESRHLMRLEKSKHDRTVLKLPATCNYSGSPTLEDDNDWLSVVFENRKAPPVRNKGTLMCLQDTGMEGMKTGPGVERMLKVLSDPTLRKEYRTGGLAGFKPRRRREMRNPMGASLPPGASLTDELLPSRMLQLALAEAPEEDQGSEAPFLEYEEEGEEEAAEAGSSGHGEADDGGGVFFNLTEVDEFTVVPPRPVRQPAAPGPDAAAVAALSAMAQAPSADGTFFSTTNASSTNGASTMYATSFNKSSSVPVLPRLQAGGSAASSQRSFNPSNAAQDRQAQSESKTQALPAGRRGGQTREPPKERDPEVVKAQRILKSFGRIVPGKSILVLTDKASVRKSIMRALLCTCGEANLVFLKNSNDLWRRFSDPKEQHHALLLDLEKTELQVESLLTTIRGHNRYGKLPIVVLSEQRELPQLVHENCSFVVFQPLAATTLREALLWCFDRKVLAVTGKYEVSASALTDATPEERRMDDWSSMAVHATPAPFGTAGPEAISVGA
mmetsp:Transcript_33877/g.100628  ORF Transcript_33877/g.100628 Transcript_33877/m.100628 type:complete len:963 (-) Transcript_33877:47-2935(-)